MSSVFVGSLVFSDCLHIHTGREGIARPTMRAASMCGQIIKSFTNSAYGAPQYTPLFSLYHKVGTNKMVKYSGPHTHQNMRYKIDDICLSLLENIYLMGSCGGGGVDCFFTVHRNATEAIFATIRRFREKTGLRPGQHYLRWQWHCIGLFLSHRRCRLTFNLKTKQFLGPWFPANEKM